MKKLLLSILLVLGLGTPAFAQQDILKSSTAYKCPFLMIDSSDHVSGKTGATVTVTISKNAGSFGTPASGGTATEISSGWYYLAFSNAGDTGTDGPIALHATATGADPTDVLCGTVVDFDPRSSTTVQQLVDAYYNQAMSGYTTGGTGGKYLSDINTKAGYLPSATAGAAGGVFIAGTNAATTVTTSLTTHVVGTVDTVTNLTNAPTAGDFTATMKTSIRTAASPAVQKNVAKEWPMKFTNSSTGAPVTSGTPSCTRSIDAPASFAAGTLGAPSAVSSNGISEITLNAGDLNGSYYTILKCTLATANDYYNVFVIQP